MGKNDFLTPKAIANRIKAKGLQKLRWYCQMCQKQCRDKKGFKCHCMSESHQRQILIFGENPNRVFEGYSEEFEISFLEHMKRSHRFSRIAATVVYNEYINHRHHVHMNSTESATLTEFVKHLGRRRPRAGSLLILIGILEVSSVERFTLHSETLFKEREKMKRVKADLAEEEKQEREIKKQIERVYQSKLPNADNVEGHGGEEVSREFKVESGVKIEFALGGLKKDKGESSKLVFEEVEDERKSKKAKTRGGNGGGAAGLALEELMREEERKKERVNRKDYWVCEGGDHCESYE
ncbi:putative DNA/RNA-binding protein Kin17 [Rosa chinensis]|uniref:Putative DNA/RNA-binding protein Kin17 n=1 Tax=Rosa chinensis TaxID=74649 RepID=A0A2P6QUH0_ROSCH|nr:putative DNA/RNA-binding protein Kin17 [Rosa chinensis]